jgi:hypothetical protein
MKNIKVIDFEMDDLIISTTTALNGVVVNFNVVRKKYEKWLIQKDYLVYEDELISLKDYWTLDEEIIKRDLENYIIEYII